MIPSTFQLMSVVRKLWQSLRTFLSHVKMIWIVRCNMKCIPTKFEQRKENMIVYHKVVTICNRLKMFWYILFKVEKVLKSFVKVNRNRTSCFHYREPCLSEASSKETFFSDWTYCKIDWKTQWSWLNLERLFSIHIIIFWHE